ncbi:hypothetical protein TNCV_1354361 [Trichonephila clavipes]|nr:hypothetical protein TNCV_1354361 [Trichonephila clavipes]
MLGHTPEIVGDRLMERFELNTFSILDVIVPMFVSWGQHRSSHRVRKVRLRLLGTRDQVPLEPLWERLVRAERIATTEITFRIWWRMLAISMKCETICAPRFGAGLCQDGAHSQFDRCLKVTLSGRLFGLEKGFRARNVAASRSISCPRKPSPSRQWGGKAGGWAP